MNMKLERIKTRKENDFYEKEKKTKLFDNILISLYFDRYFYTCFIFI